MFFLITVGSAAYLLACAARGCAPSLGLGGDGAVPRVGGLAIALVTIASALGVFDPAVGPLFDFLTPWFCAGVAAFCTVGVIDDRLEVRPATKFGLQCVAAIGISALHPTLPPRESVLLAVSILVAVNAVNLTDVSDGLVLSIAITAFAALVFVSQSELAAFMTFACLGVLALNHPPATIYLGEAGAQVIGFALVASTLSGGELKLSALVSLLFVFLCEVTLLVVARSRRGIPFWRKSDDHFSLQLQRRGWSLSAINATAAAVALVAASALRSF